MTGDGLAPSGYQRLRANYSVHLEMTSVLNILFASCWQFRCNAESRVWRVLPTTFTLNCARSHLKSLLCLWSCQPGHHNFLGTALTVRHPAQQSRICRVWAGRIVSEIYRNPSTGGILQQLNFHPGCLVVIPGAN
jgi:hypothetical protein